MAISTNRDLDAALAVTRFGLGARPGEIDAAKSDPREFLRAQIRAAGADQPQFFTSVALKTTAERLAVPNRPGFVRPPNAAQAGAQGAQSQQRVVAQNGAPQPGANVQNGAQQVARPQLDAQQRRQLLQARNQPMQDEFLARAQTAALTEAGFRERWALFWFNHFTVSVTNRQAGQIAGNFEREAIRPNVFGHFSDLLLASSHHPAMLLYLNQTQSIGPDSEIALNPPPPPVRRIPAAAVTPAGVAAAQGAAVAAPPPRPVRKPGLNENLAREIMELHSLGVDAGYAQDDVTEFARALTGWRIGGPRDDAFVRGKGYFRAEAHEPGPRHIFGKDYPQDGEAQSDAALFDFAASPHTAHHLATKIARHFVADDPPQSLVTKLVGAYVNSGGRLDTVAETLIMAPESWDPAARKFKTPYEFLVSSWRAGGAKPMAYADVAQPVTALGQRPFGAPSPKGWEDETADWATPDAIVKRMSWTTDFADSLAAGLNPVEVAAGALGARLSKAVATAVARAESRSEAFAVLFMSPEFQRR
jgi:uncharacterized protein (DUF1800 family)